MDDSDFLVGQQAASMALSTVFGLELMLEAESEGAETDADASVLGSVQLLRPSIVVRFFVEQAALIVQAIVGLVTEAFLLVGRQDSRFRRNRMAYEMSRLQS